MLPAGQGLHTPSPQIAAKPQLVPAFGPVQSPLAPQNRLSTAGMMHSPAQRASGLEQTHSAFTQSKFTGHRTPAVEPVQAPLAPQNSVLRLGSSQVRTTFVPGTVQTNEPAGHA